MPESIQFSFDLPVSPERVYRAWFDSFEYSQFSGSPAQIDPRVGGDFTLRGGFIRGKNLVMTPFSHIVQTWQAADFPPGSPDSTVDIQLEPTCLGALFTLTQTGVPAGQSSRILQDWVDACFRPLLDYFEALLSGTAADIDG
jgi:uncharacterized protein YndB with AHSA1/START domain